MNWFRELVDICEHHGWTVVWIVIGACVLLSNLGDFIRAVFWGKP
jgi:hypothetical protein